jgi:hypothetical protein
MAYQTCLKIHDKSWSNGDSWHVGQTGLEATFTWQPGWKPVCTYTTDEHGYPALHIIFKKPIE